MQMTLLPQATQWSSGNCYFPGNKTIANRISLTNTTPPGPGTVFSCGVGPIRGLVPTRPNSTWWGCQDSGSSCCCYQSHNNVLCEDNNVCGRNQALSGLRETNHLTNIGVVIHVVNGNPCFNSATSLNSKVDEVNINLLEISRTCVESLCPKGSFVMQMTLLPNAAQWSFGNCYFPGKKTVAKKIALTTSTPPYPGTEFSCGVGPIRGLVPTRPNSTSWGCNWNPDDPNSCCCYQTHNNVLCEDNNVCGRNQALSGLRETNHSTNPFHYVCSDVGHPAELCDPSDILQLILVCDMLDAMAPSECRYSQTVGYGNSTEQSETDRLEHQFYSEMNFEVGASGFGLSATFGGKLGQSETTGFDWTRASGQTWNVQTTIEVTLTVPAGIKTFLYQAVGKCSFYSVATNFYKRVDTDRRGQVVSQSTFFK